MQHDANTELAVHDLQRQLLVLGYRLGDEAKKGLFGERTAAAVATFKESNGLGCDDVLDQSTWTALRDASRQTGDRLLYLHMPHFRGRDVGELQGALSSMGFSCVPDSSFGPETEQALRDFQANMGLEPTGMFDEAGLAALLRLRHLWDGKRGYSVEGRILDTARSVRVLEAVPVCVFGTDESTRAIANRIANLARATTLESKIVSASALAAEPGRDMLLVGLEQETGETRKRRVQPGNSATPTVYLGEATESAAELKQAVAVARKQHNRLSLVMVTKAHEGEDKTAQDQELAARVLDLLCDALAPLRESES
ncbi:MAG: peptidoglycan-binding protein [Coriobacteriales bacterium]|jgi:peptidoglycan hydrolase-like protein with peptidoglycan-binding domain|nr:peptidoglycan-binding protein [Coriobacteriales bacterium]